MDFKDGKFVVTFDGQKVIEAGDESFTEAGKIGVWTKADCITLFDDFTKALGTKPGAGLNAPPRWRK